jgi:hypothetical protein
MSPVHPGNEPDTDDMFKTPGVTGEEPGPEPVVPGSAEDFA